MALGILSTESATHANEPDRVYRHGARPTSLQSLRRRSSETIRTHGAVPPCQLTIYACDGRTADESNHGDTRGGHAGRGGAATRRSPCLPLLSGRWSSRWLTSESEDSKLHTMTTHAYSSKTRSHILFAIANLMIELDRRHHKDCGEIAFPVVQLRLRECEIRKALQFGKFDYDAVVRRR